MQDATEYYKRHMALDDVITFLQDPNTSFTSKVRALPDAVASAWCNYFGLRQCVRHMS